MGNVLDADDLVSARAAIITAKINNRVETLAEVKSLKANIAFDKTDVKTLGSKSTQKKITGWNGTGTLEIYQSTSRFNEILLEYTKYNKTIKFDIVVTVDDKTAASIGKETTKLGRCSLDGGDILNLDTGGDFLNASYNFTFEDWDILEKFKQYKTISL